MSNYAAYGTLLKLGGTTVAGVTNIGGPGLTLETIDVTNHSSTNAWREFVGGLKDGGEVSLDIVFDPAAATHRNASGGLLYLLTTRVSGSFSITFPDSGGTVWSFTAFVTSFEPSGAVADGLTASVTLKITGAPTLA